MPSNCCRCSACGCTAEKYVPCPRHSSDWPPAAWAPAPHADAGGKPRDFGMSAPDNDGDVEAVEIGLLLDGVYRRYGFDFRDYAYSSMKRRIENVMRAEGLQRVSELQGKL